MKNLKTALQKIKTQAWRLSEDEKYEKLEWIAENVKSTGDVLEVLEALGSDGPLSGNPLLDNPWRTISFIGIMLRTNQDLNFDKYDPLVLLDTIISSEKINSGIFSIVLDKQLERLTHNEQKDFMHSLISQIDSSSSLEKDVNPEKLLKKRHIIKKLLELDPKIMKHKNAEDIKNIPESTIKFLLKSGMNIITSATLDLFIKNDKISLETILEIDKNSINYYHEVSLLEKYIDIKRPAFTAQLVSHMVQHHFNPNNIIGDANRRPLNRLFRDAGSYEADVKILESLSRVAELTEHTQIYFDKLKSLGISKEFLNTEFMHAKLGKVTVEKYLSYLEIAQVSDLASAKEKCRYLTPQDFANALLVLNDYQPSGYKKRRFSIQELSSAFLKSQHTVEEKNICLSAMADVIPDKLRFIINGTINPEQISRDNLLKIHQNIFTYEQTIAMNMGKELIEKIKFEHKNDVLHKAQVIIEAVEEFKDEVYWSHRHKLSKTEIKQVETVFTSIIDKLYDQKVRLSSPEFKLPAFDRIFDHMDSKAFAELAFKNRASDKEKKVLSPEIKEKAVNNLIHNLNREQIEKLIESADRYHQKEEFYKGMISPLQKLFDLIDALCNALSDKRKLHNKVASAGIEELLTKGAGLNENELQLSPENSSGISKKTDNEVKQKLGKFVDMVTNSSPSPGKGL